MVGATRSMRVASVTLPSLTGTLRSTRTSTRLPAMSVRVSRVLKAMGRLPAGQRGYGAREGAIRISSDQFAKRNGRVGHAVREAPLVVVPGQDAHEVAVEDLGLVGGEVRGVAVVVEVDRDERAGDVVEDALQFAFGGGLDGGVDFVGRDVARRHELQ